MALRLREGLLWEAFATLREHGAGRRECVVYFTGARALPGHVDGVLHPRHRASPSSYEIDGRWLTRTWIDLASADREMRMQVHTHGAKAFHSKTDNDFPVLQTRGFLSLVIPNFATGPVSLRNSFLAELQDDGHWIELDPERELVLS